MNANSIFGDTRSKGLDKVKCMWENTVVANKTITRFFLIGCSCLLDERLYVTLMWPPQGSCLPRALSIRMNSLALFRVQPTSTSLGIAQRGKLQARGDSWRQRAKRGLP